MKRNLLITLVLCLLCFSIVSCDGGDGQEEEVFTIFDVLIDPDLSGCNLNQTPNVPNNELKLSLLSRGRNISGTGELLAFGNVGEAYEIMGRSEDGSFSLSPFEAGAASDPTPEDQVQTGMNSIVFAFNEIAGEFVDDDMDRLVDGIEGSFSASLTIVEGTESINCEDIFGEISGIARRPEGCVSRIEIPTLECPAQGFVTQCEQYDFIMCGGCESINGEIICFDTAIIPSDDCIILDCESLSCDVLGTVNLEEDGGIVWSNDIGCGY